VFLSPKGNDMYDGMTENSPMKSILGAVKLYKGQDEEFVFRLITGEFPTDHVEFVNMTIRFSAASNRSVIIPPDNPTNSLFVINDSDISFRNATIQIKNAKFSLFVLAGSKNQLGGLVIDKPPDFVSPNAYLIDCLYGKNTISDLTVDHVCIIGLISSKVVSGFLLCHGNVQSLTLARFGCFFSKYFFVLV
jgi:hypothetical protein